MDIYRVPQQLNGNEIMCISQVFVRVKSFEEEIENTVIKNYK
jgi:hypothetical protein